MRKLTLGRFPETVLADAKNEAAAVLARVWTGGANIVMNPGAVARHLDRAGLERLGAVLDRHWAAQPRPAAGLRLVTLTGARLSEVLNLRWDAIEDLAEDGVSVRLEDSKTGPRTVWLGPQAAKDTGAGRPPPSTPIWTMRRCAPPPPPPRRFDGLVRG